MRVDVHQHLWPEPFLAELRARTEPPLLDGWRLVLAGEPAAVIDQADHQVEPRARQAAAECDLALVSLSSPLGIEWLPESQAVPLLAAFHDGVAALPAPFGGWAAAGLDRIDPDALSRELDRGFVGLQLPATALADAAGYARCAPLLALLAERDRPLFVHPGAAPPEPDPATGATGWWPALVPYVQQLHAAWFAFRAFGRPDHPRLRVCFAALAGLGPLHGERLAARSGPSWPVDPEIYVETSSYADRAVDATLRVLGVDTVVNGSDRPYATPYDPEPALGAAAAHAVRTTNPLRLLGQDLGRGEAR